MGNLYISFYFGINLTLRVHASTWNLRRLTYQFYHHFALACVFYLEDVEMILVWKKADVICVRLLKICSVEWGRARGEGKRKQDLSFSLINKLP